jgi:hypothetical protein
LTYVNACRSVELQRAALKKGKLGSSLLAVEDAQFLLHDKMPPIRLAPNTARPSWCRWPITKLRPLRH